MIRLQKFPARIVVEHFARQNLVAVVEVYAAGRKRLARGAFRSLEYRQFDASMLDVQKFRNFCGDLLSPMLSCVGLREFEKPWRFFLLAPVPEFRLASKRFGFKHTFRLNLEDNICIGHALPADYTVISPLISRGSSRSRAARSFWFWVRRFWIWDMIGSAKSLNESTRCFDGTAISARSKSPARTAG